MTSAETREARRSTEVIPLSLIGGKLQADEASCESVKGIVGADQDCIVRMVFRKKERPPVERGSVSVRDWIEVACKE